MSATGNAPENTDKSVDVEQAVRMSNLLNAETFGRIEKYHPMYQPREAAAETPAEKFAAMVVDSAEKMANVFFKYDQLHVYDSSLLAAQNIRSLLLEEEQSDVLSMTYPFTYHLHKLLIENQIIDAVMNGAEDGPKYDMLVETDRVIGYRNPIYVLLLWFGNNHKTGEVLKRLLATHDEVWKDKEQAPKDHGRVASIRDLLSIHMLAALAKTMDTDETDYAGVPLEWVEPMLLENVLENLDDVDQLQRIYDAEFEEISFDPANDELHETDDPMGALQKLFPGAEVQGM